MKLILILLAVLLSMGCSFFKSKPRIPDQSTEWRAIADTISCNSIFDLLKEEIKQGNNPTSYTLDDINILKIMNEKQKCFTGKSILFIENVFGNPTRIEDYAHGIIYYYWIDYENENRLDSVKSRTSFVYSIKVSFVKNEKNKGMTSNFVHFTSNVFH